jgi:hypothetical protein
LSFWAFLGSRQVEFKNTKMEDGGHQKNSVVGARASWGGGVCVWGGGGGGGGQLL